MMMGEEPLAISPASTNILVVDDTRASLRLLVEILAGRGYRVRPATSGQIALMAIRQDLPDLILLDVMMPEMDGFMICQALKADERTRDIPVIFITALDTVHDKVKAFAAGGVDYITKPFQAEEVLARVETHLTLRQTQHHLQEQVAELDAFAHTIAHDIKSLMSVISGYTDILMDSLTVMDADELQLSLKNMQWSARKVAKIVEALLLLARVRKTTIMTGPLNMAAIIAEAQRRLAPMIARYQGQIILPMTWPAALGYAPWIEEVWVNYLSNGLKYGGSPPRLELGAAPQPDGWIRFWVQDNGVGISSADQAILFTEFTRLKQIQAEGYGLGLSIVRRIIDKLGGQVGVDSEPGQGSRFYFTLPAG